jgi:hypothetical protein
MVGEPDEEPGYQSFLVARTDNDEITEFEDIVGKRVCFVDPASTSGFLVPAAGLHRRGHRLRATTSPSIFAGGHDASVISVAAGDCDAGFAFDSMVTEILPSQGDIEEGEIKIVWESPIIAGSPMAMRTGLPQSLQDAITEIFAEKINVDWAAENGYCEIGRSRSCARSPTRPSGATSARRLVLRGIRSCAGTSGPRTRLSARASDDWPTGAGGRALRDVRKEFDNGRVVALDGVSLDIHAGELTVLIGSVGLGEVDPAAPPQQAPRAHQRVTSRCSVATWSTPRGGAARPAPRRRLHLPAVQHRGSPVVPGERAVGCARSGAGPRYGVLTYPKAMRREALECLDRVGLADRAFQRADTLSGGQQQRVAIARTIMQKPKLVWPTNRSRRSTRRSPGR